jgi:hypothetical protein
LAVWNRLRVSLCVSLPLLVPCLCPIRLCAHRPCAQVSCGAYFYSVDLQWTGSTRHASPTNCLFQNAKPPNPKPYNFFLGGSMRILVKLWESVHTKAEGQRAGGPAIRCGALPMLSYTVAGHARQNLHCRQVSRAGN